MLHEASAESVKAKKAVKTAAACAKAAKKISNLARSIGQKALAKKTNYEAKVWPQRHSLLRSWRSTAQRELWKQTHGLHGGGGGANQSGAGAGVDAGGEEGEEGEESGGQETWVDRWIANENANSKFLTADLLDSLIR